MNLDFMTPDVWNGLVLGVVLVGLALAALRIYSDWSHHQRQESSRTGQSTGLPRQHDAQNEN